MRYTILLFVLLFSFTAQAQNGSKIAELRMTYLKKKLNLDSRTARDFWPIYEKYTLDKKSVYQSHTRNGNIKSQNDIEDRLNRDQEMLDLKKKYTHKISRILSPIQIKKLNQSEKDFRNLLIKRSSNRQTQPSRGINGNGSSSKRYLRAPVQRQSASTSRINR